jgi:hypothetical protein
MEMRSIIETEKTWPKSELKIREVKALFVVKLLKEIM